MCRMEGLVVVLCSFGAILFVFCAVRLRQKRLRLAIPASLLGLLAVYELYMIHWERTVVAPIRIDLFLEIPLMLIAWTWGVLALILSSRSSAA
jgi:4-amino-4-deoxy-L-arabinose transferase-like glycosyltransferase